MTKRKAIEAALICTCGKPQCNQRTRRPEIAADRAYELGRIAGLREAARDMERGYDDPEADEAALAVNEALDELALQLRSRANRLARKVRTK